MVAKEILFTMLGHCLAARPGRAVPPMGRGVGQFLASKVTATRYCLNMLGNFFQAKAPLLATV